MRYQRHTELYKMWTIELHYKDAHLAKKTVNKCKEVITAKVRIVLTFGEQLPQQVANLFLDVDSGYKIVRLINIHSAMNF